MEVYNRDGNTYIPDVFYIELLKDKMTVKPIAFNVVISPAMAWWADTGNGHSIKIRDFKILDDSIELTTPDNTVYRMQRLTLKIFNEKVKDKVMPLKQEYTSDQELRDYYLDTNFFP